MSKSDETQAVSEGSNPVKKTGRRKIAMFTGLLLVLEAVVVVGAFSMFTSPRTTEAMSMISDDIDVVEAVYSEVLVFDDRLYNDRLGTAFEYRVKVAVKVLEENTVWVEDKAARFSNELHMELDTIWRSADPRHLREVDKRTLTTKIHRMLDQWLIKSPSEGSMSGESVVSEVVLVPSPGIRINR